MIQRILIILILVFGSLLTFDPNNSVLALDIENGPYAEINHNTNHTTMNHCHSSCTTQKWFIKAFEDSGEMPLFGWAKNTASDENIRNFALVATNKRIYLFDRRLGDWKTMDYSMSNKVFEDGKVAKNFCLFWTE